MYGFMVFVIIGVGNVGVCAYLSSLMCVCARLAPGSRAITLYEVWQGESKTSAHPEKSPGLGLMLSFGSENTPSLLYTEFLSENKIKMQCMFRTHAQLEPSHP